MPTQSIFLKGVVFPLSLLTATMQPLLAKTIHVSITGSDNATGTITEPLKTIGCAVQEANEFDVIMVQGGTYHEEVIINDKQNITLKGREGEQVIISGTGEITSEWIEDLERPGVFKTTLDNSLISTSYTQFFVNGNHQQMARFPDNLTGDMLNPMDPKSGYAVITNGVKPKGRGVRSNITFTSHGGTPTLPNVEFTDEAVIRGLIGKLRNNIFSASTDGADIKRDNEQLISFIGSNDGVWKNDSSYTSPEGFGYIFDLSVLDKAGEWFYKRNSNTLYYKPEGDSMEGLSVEVRQRKWGLRVSGSDHLKIENIHFKAAAVDIRNSDFLHVNKASFQYITPFLYRRNYAVLKEGIIITNSDNGIYENSLIANTWGSGIILDSGSDNIIRNNIIENIGWLGQFTVSLFNEGENTLISQNTFGRSGRFHIRTTAPVKSIITDNDFYEAMSMGEDAGSIMMTSTAKTNYLDLKDTVIAYNKIHDLHGVPAMDTSPSYSRQTIKALYLEDVDNYTVHHNFIYNINATGYERITDGREVERDGSILYLGPRSRSMTRKLHYYNNTFWNYDSFINIWHHSDRAKDIHGLIANGEMKNNIMLHNKSHSLNGNYAFIQLPGHRYRAAGRISNIREYSLANFITEIAKAPYNYTITESNNSVFSEEQYVSNFKDPNAGDFRLFPESDLNNNGAEINSITGDAPVARGAWEGNTEFEKERIFRAGSTLSRDLFPNYNDIATID